jgi:hypothetical protein
MWWQIALVAAVAALFVVRLARVLARHRGNAAEDLAQRELTSS